MKNSTKYEKKSIKNNYSLNSLLPCPLQGQTNNWFDKGIVENCETGEKNKEIQKQNSKFCDA